jgi:amidase
MPRSAPSRRCACWLRFAKHRRWTLVETSPAGLSLDFPSRSRTTCPSRVSRWGCGSTASDPQPQPADHEVVRRLRAAGAVVVGLTRVPELCVFGATDSKFGLTRNPWNRSRTPGGSSGGSAAAVAAGMVAVAHGNDGMGSIRIPAACCGLVGFKPGRGVVPSELGDGSWFDMAENGPLATSVDDCALLLSVMAGRPDLATVTDPGRVRVAVSTEAPAPFTRRDTRCDAGSSPRGARRG